MRFELAELYALTGYFEEAIELYRALASGQDPVAARARFGLAQVFERSAQPRAALREYIAYLELFPAARQGEAARELELLKETEAASEGLPVPGETWGGVEDF